MTSSTTTIVRVPATAAAVAVAHTPAAVREARQEAVAVLFGREGQVADGRDEVDASLVELIKGFNANLKLFKDTNVQLVAQVAALQVQRRKQEEVTAAAMSVLNAAVEFLRAELRTTRLAFEKGLKELWSAFCSHSHPPSTGATPAIHRVITVKNPRWHPDAPRRHPETLPQDVWTPFIDSSQQEKKEGKEK